MSSLPSRIIAHLDMDAFYASAELLRYPQLRGLPLVIGGGRDAQPISKGVNAEGQPIYEFARLKSYAGRGVVTTATYEARALGVHSAMGMMKAAKLAPEAILLPIDFAHYRYYSGLFKQTVRHIVPCVEDRGIDEIYLDLTALLDPIEDCWEQAYAIGLLLKKSVFDATGLSCSIGITFNKLLAKMASDLDKPDGLTIVKPEDVPTKIWPLSITKVNGIGPKAAARLHHLEIFTIEQLAQTPLEKLVATFGKHTGQWLHDAAWGRDDRELVTHSKPKSMSRETTFEKDLHVLHDKTVLTQHLINLCARVAEDLKRKAYLGKTIGVKLRFDDFQVITRDVTVEAFIADQDSILVNVRQLLKKILSQVDLKSPHAKRLRLLGVRVGKLITQADWLLMQANQQQHHSPISRQLSLPGFDD